MMFGIIYHICKLSGSVQHEICLSIMNTYIAYNTDRYQINFDAYRNLELQQTALTEGVFFFLSHRITERR
jgi:hypothetical protein